MPAHQRPMPADFAERFNEMKMRDLKTHYRAGDKAIYRWKRELAAAGVKIKESRWLPEEVAAALDMRRRGMTCEQIGARLNRSAGAVKAVCLARREKLTRQQVARINANNRAKYQIDAALFSAFGDEGNSMKRADPATANLRFIEAYRAAAKRNAWIVRQVAA